MRIVQSKFAQRTFFCYMGKKKNPNQKQRAPWEGIGITWNKTSDAESECDKAGHAMNVCIAFLIKSKCPWSCISNTGHHVNFTIIEILTCLLFQGIHPTLIPQISQIPVLCATGNHRARRLNLLWSSFTAVIFIEQTEEVWGLARGKKISSLNTALISPAVRL